MVQSAAFKDVTLERTSLPSLVPNQDGETEVRCCTLHRTLRSSLAIWEYAPGEFDWWVDEDQSACVLAGTAQVDLADGRSLTLLPGTAIFLPRGLHGHWIVKETLRTVAVRGS
jgi:uncharacterized cupin superfamily protein